jgi:hypothetical protein
MPREGDECPRCGQEPTAHPAAGCPVPREVIARLLAFKRALEPRGRLASTVMRLGINLRKTTAIRSKFLARRLALIREFPVHHSKCGARSARGKRS